MMRFLVIFLFTFFCLPAAASDRIALLIGNGAYDLNELSLRNPVNDVDALEVALGDLGFEVKTVRNASRRAMKDGLAWLEENGVDADMAIVFYAGHGVQVGGENYLIGTEVGRLQAETIAGASLTLAEIRASMDRIKADIGMILLDACRDNPMAASGQTLPGLAVSRGGAGTLVAYATDPGNVAYDGAGKNSVFTKALLNTLATPALEVRIMFGRVRQSVIRQTGGRQIPWVEEAVLGEHYLVPGSDEKGSIAADEVAFWREVGASGDSDRIAVYLDRYPEGLFAPFAQARIEELKSVRDRALIAAGPAETVLGSVDQTAVASALDVLGYNTLTRGIVPARAELAQAFNAWRAAQPNPQEASPETLMRDAARLTMFLAASTAQRIRADLKALSGIEGTLDLAQSDLAEIRDLAARSEMAKDLLPLVEEDVAAMQDDHETVAQRLDSSREYYHRLVLLAEEHFQRQTRTDLLSQAPLTRSSGFDVQSKVFRDAKTFVGQVERAAGRPRGSYGWLAEFVAEGLTE